MRRLVVALMATAFAVRAVEASAQDESTAASAVLAFIERLAAAPADDEGELLTELQQNFGQALLMQRASSEELAFRRTDVQGGASSAASGSTSVTSSPVLPAIFGAAMESGALTRSVSGSTITLKVNPAGLLCASRPDVVMAVARREDDACRTVWKRVGATLSFDATRGEKKAALEDLQTLERQFAELLVRVELVNRRKPGVGGLQRRFKKDYEDWHASAANLGEQVDAIVGMQAAKAELAARLKELRTSAKYKALSPGNTADVKARAAAIASVVNAVAASSALDGAEIARVRKAWLTSLRSFGVLANAVANAPILTAEYGLQKPDLAKVAIGDVVPEGGRPPSVHSLRVIYAQGVPRRQLDITANLSASVFDEVRPGMAGRFRDIRAAAEGKWKLRQVGSYGVPTFSMAAMYVYLHQQPLGLGLAAFNKTAIEEKGHIGLFQAKLEFPTSNNAVRIPLSFTYSNRTEMVEESEVRGQFGLSFNLDALFGSK